MLRLAVRAGVSLLLVSTLTTPSTSAGMQNRHSLGAMSFAQPPAAGPRLLPRGSHGLPLNTPAPTGSWRRMALPPMGLSAEGARAPDNAARATAAVEAQRQLNRSAAAPGFVQRDTTRWPSPDIGRREGFIPFTVRQMTGGTTLSGLPLVERGVSIRQTTAGTTLTGLPLTAKGSAVVRGPFLINPAFAQSPGRSGAASTLSQTTFRGRFGERSQRSGHRAVVIGWIGSLFWPYAYGDLIDYTFWPSAYDSFWPRAYDDVYEGIFGPYAVDAASYGSERESSYVDEPQSLYAPLPSGGGKLNVRRKGEYLAQVCNVPMSGLADWPIEQIAKVVDPDNSQRAALDQLKDAAEQAIDLLRSGCASGRERAACARQILSVA
jgi:hypothetical protein